MNTQHLLRRATLALALALPLIFSTTQVLAQGFPTKTIRIIVPFPPGAADLMARYLCEKFSQTLGQPCVVENKPGAASTIGMDFVAKSDPDGHTLLLAANYLPIVPSLYPKLPFDAVKDLAPIAMISRTPVMIGAHPSFPPKSFQEFIAYVRANPGKVNFTSCGLGSSQHLAGESLNVRAGIQMVHIPYKGCGPAEVDVLGGRVPVFISNTSRFMPQIRAGKLRGYALTGAQRTELAPGYPTVAELGFTGFDFDVWFGLLAPGRTPKEIITRLNAETNRVFALPDVKERLISQSFEIISGTPEQFAELIRADIERYAKVINDSGIRAE